MEESSDEEDARKPAARPTITTIDRPPSVRDESSATDTLVAVPVAGELPFLVTHWLSGYARGDLQNAETDEQRAAQAKIRKAAADLASAFSELGAFGITARVRTNDCLFLV